MNSINKQSSPYKPIMTIVSVRKKPPKTWIQKCCSFCTVRSCGVLILASALVAAAIGLEIRLQQILATDLRNAGEEPFWCGDWTPFGNLGNESYDPTSSEPVDPAIPSCSKTKVGMNYKAKPGLLYCSPDLTAYNRTAAYLALDIRFMDKTRSEYTLVSHSRSLADLLIETTPSLCKYTVGAWEIVFVLDASIDDSLQVLHHVFTSPLCLQSSMIRARVYIQPLPGMLETSSLNLAMSAARPSHFYIHVPANALIQDTGWNRDLARAALAYNDVFSVSGQCGTSLQRSSHEEPEYMIGRCTDETQTIFASDEERMDTDNSIYVTETNTRGPILWRADALRDLGFLNEANHFEHDNDELNRRAYLLRGWYSAFKYVQSHVMDYEMLVEEMNDDDSWMHRHVWRYFGRKSNDIRIKPSSSASSSTHLPESAQLALSHYRRSRARQPKVTCDSSADDRSAYFHPYHVHPDRRELARDFDANEPLPPLPALI